MTFCPLVLIKLCLAHGKKITAGMETSPAPLRFLTVSVITPNSRYFGCKKLGLSNVAPAFCSWISWFTQKGGIATLCPTTSRRQLWEQQGSSCELKIWTCLRIFKQFSNISIKFDYFWVVKSSKSPLKNKDMSHISNSQELHCCFQIVFDKWWGKL